MLQKLRIADDNRFTLSRVKDAVSSWNSNLKQWPGFASSNTIKQSMQCDWRPLFSPSATPHSVEWGLFGCGILQH